MSVQYMLTHASGKFTSITGLMTCSFLCIVYVKRKKSLCNRPVILTISFQHCVNFIVRRFQNLASLN